MARPAHRPAARDLTRLRPRRHVLKPRATAALAIALVAPAGVIGACRVDPLDAAGKKCPCASGFVCDTPSNTCVAAGASLRGDARADVHAGDGGADGGGLVGVQDLKSTWQTGNGLRWDWQALGRAADFDHYEIVTGPTAEDVRARATTTRRFDPSTNPELGSFSGRDATVTNGPVALWTVTDGHKEGETVFAQVSAYDKSGGVTTSDIASETTTRPRATLVVYDDGLPDGGVTTPAGTKTSTQTPYAGTQCLEHIVDCGGPATCAKEIGVTSIDGVSASGIDVTDFDRAYFELAIRGTNVPGAYSDVVLILGGDGCGPPCRMRFSGESFRAAPSDWRLVQVPLRVLKRNDGTGANLSYAELSNRNFRANGFLLAGSWPDASKVGLDQVRIRW